MDPCGRLSLQCFLAGLSISLLLICSGISLPASELLKTTCPLLFVFHFAFFNGAIYALLSGHAYQVGVRAGFLGWTFAMGLYMSLLAPPSWRVFGWYTCVMAFFHYSEYLTTAVINPRTLTLDSFLLNHSREYCVAAVASWCEFWIERWIWPGLKEHFFVSTIGLLMCFGGEFLRKLAMLTAKSNFNHVIQSVREDDHTLVTHGIYGLFRHPSYVGWFYWSIGTQLILCNPVCTLAYTLASWQFFRERILVEELTLLTFFGEDYHCYQKKVGTGLPLIHGCRLEQ